MKTVDIPGVGEVQITKHALSHNIRLSVNGGKVKVTIPKWAPYQAGVAFAHSRKDWITSHRVPQDIIKDGTAIGKFHHLYFKASQEVTSVTTRRKGSELWVRYPAAKKSTDPSVQKAAEKIAIKALREQAERLLPGRLRDLAKKHDFEFKSVSVRQLKARWGSCNSKKEITLNLFLMQVPWDLIDYVLIHELVHTEHMDHSAEFWARFEREMPGAKKRRKLLHVHKPQINA